MTGLSIIFFMAAVAFAGEATYNPNQKPDRPIWCRLHDPLTKNSYFSSIFVANTNNLYPVQNAFLHFVATKYSYKIVPGVDQYHMPVECKASILVSDTKSSKDAEVESEQANAFKVIETEWTFGNTKAVEEPATHSPANTSSSPNGAAAQDEKLDTFTMATLQQDPRGMRLSPLDRQFVMSEAPKAKSYCAKDPQLSQSLDCTCFVRTVFNYRVAHASGPIQQTNFPPLATILTKPDFSCSECVKGANHNGVACDHASKSQ